MRAKQCCYLLLCTLLSACTPSSSDWLDYKDLPDRYLFLVFPKVPCAAELHCPDRVLLVDKKELDTGLVEYTDASGASQTVSLANLSLTPTEQTKLLLHRPETTLSISGYSHLEWDQKVDKSGQREIRLELKDSKHGRIEVFSYLVSGGKVVRAEQVKVKSWADLLFLFTAFIAVLIGYRLFRPARN